MRKSFLAIALNVGLLLGLVLSPYGLPGLKGIKDAQASAAAQKATVDNTLVAVQSALVGTVQNFVDARTFGIAYNDVSHLAEVVNSVSGLEISGIYRVDPEQNYIDLGYYTEGSTADAVRFEILVENTASALSVLETLQLPVVYLEIEEPDFISVIFLTGGEV